MADGGSAERAPHARTAGGGGGGLWSGRVGSDRWTRLEEAAEPEQQRWVAFGRRREVDDGDLPVAEDGAAVLASATAAEAAAAGEADEASEALTTPQRR